MSALEAQSYFNRIGEGHRNAIKRPWDSSTDRVFRAMVEEANSNGDCIIPREDGEGYYRPIPSDPVDAKEFRAYMAKEKAKVRTMQKKYDSMRLKYETMQVAYESRGVYDETNY